MNLRALRRRCEERLRDLELPVPFDVRAFCDRVAARRGRPVYLRPIVTHSGPWGFWAAGTVADYLFYESVTSPLHQEHIILHELAHLICGHRPTPLTRPELLAGIFPSLSPETVQQILGRVAYTTAEEQEAEVLASVLLERIGATRSAAAPSADGLTSGEAEVLDRLVVTL